MFTIFHTLSKMEFSYSFSSLSCSLFIWYTLDLMVGISTLPSKFWKASTQTYSTTWRRTSINWKWTTRFQCSLIRGWLAGMMKLRKTCPSMFHRVKRSSPSSSFLSVFGWINPVWSGASPNDFQHSKNGIQKKIQKPTNICKNYLHMICSSMCTNSLLQVSLFQSKLKIKNFITLITVSREPGRSKWFTQCSSKSWRTNCGRVR